MDFLIKFPKITLGNITTSVDVSNIVDRNLDNDDDFSIEDIIGNSSIDIEESKQQIFSDLSEHRKAIEKTKQYNDDNNEYYNNYNNPMYNEVNYFNDKIRKYFYNVQSWKSHTNILCWSCNRRHRSRPKFIPIGKIKLVFKSDEFIPDGEHDVYEVYGNFCSIYCALYYLYNINDIHFQSLDKNNIARMIYELFNIFHPEKVKNRKIIYIPYDIDKTKMIQYGGDKSYEEFEEDLRKLDNHVIYKTK